MKSDKTIIRRDARKLKRILRAVHRTLPGTASDPFVVATIELVIMLIIETYGLKNKPDVLALINDVIAARFDDYKMERINDKIHPFNR